MIEFIRRKLAQLPYSRVVSFLLVAAMGVFGITAYALNTITDSRYLDMNQDGTIETIQWTLDENVTACTYEAGDWSVVTAGDMNIGITGISCTGTNNILNIQVTADANETGSATNPIISYTNAATADSVTLTSGPMGDQSNITVLDGAAAIILSVNLNNTGSRNRIELTYSESMSVVNGASSAAIGDLTVAGQLAGFGNFATTGNAFVPVTAKNTISSAGAVVTIDLADQAGGFFDSGSTTEPSGNFTPVASAQVVDAGGLLQVNTTVSVVSGSTGWDLTKPTLNSITVSDSAGANGRIDRAVIVFDTAMRAANFTNADGTLGTNGTTTGTFTDLGDDTNATFDRSTDDNDFNTTVAAGDFVYSGATTFLTDLAGNLLNTATPGQIATADIAELDGATPVLNPVSISSNHSNTSQAMPGNVVTISFTASEPLNAIVAADVQIDGKNADTYTNTAGNDYEATRTMQAGDTEGVITFSIDYRDAIPNSGVQVTATTDASSVSFDESDPTPAITVSDDPTFTGDLVQTVTVTYDEAMDPATSPVLTGTSTNWTQGAYVIGNWSTVTFTNDTYTVSMTHNGTPERIAAETFTIAAASGAKDLAGNDENTATSAAFVLDTQSPTVTDGNITAAITTDNNVATIAGLTDVITVTWNNSGAGDNNTDIASVTADLTAFGGVNNAPMLDDGLSGDGAAADGVFGVQLTITAGSIDNTNLNASVTVTDTSGNVTTTADTSNLSVDNQAPTVTTACISVTGASGTGGAFKFGDSPVSTWMNNNPGAGCTDNNLDIASVTFDSSNFLAGDTALAGVNAANVWTASLSGAAEAQDDINNNTTVTATDDAGNAVTLAGTNNYTVDTIVPNITDNGTLTISLDNGNAGIAALNDGTTNQDKVTQSVVTLAAADGDTETTDFTALTGEATLANGIQSGVLIAGALDNAAQTFTISVTDNAGNVSTTDTDAISVDNIAPIFAASGLSISTDAGVIGVAALNGGAIAADQVTVNATLIANDGDTITWNATPVDTGSPTIANNTAVVLTAGTTDNATQTFTVSVTDNAGNVVISDTNTIDGSTISVDNQAPVVTNNGTLTITTDAVTLAIAQVNDRVTQSLMTLTLNDGDSQTTDFTALTGEGALANGSQSGVIIIGAIDNPTQTFTSTITDNGGNFITEVTDAISVDNVPPTVSDAEITILPSPTPLGTGGAYIIGSTVVVEWDNSAATGDNNADVTSGVTVDFSGFGGGPAIAANDNGSACGDIAADGKWTACYVIFPGTIDAINVNAVVTARDDANNVTTTSDSSNLTVDNQAPVVTDANINVTINPDNAVGGIAGSTVA
ncbi:MAG: beta strand repeat-containing protein [Candidatus Altimarinota bacterium]